MPYITHITKGLYMSDPESLDYDAKCEIAHQKRKMDEYYEEVHDELEKEITPEQGKKILEEYQQLKKERGWL